MTKRARSINVVTNLGDKLFRRPRIRSRPLRIHLEVNDVCNLRCLMCARQSEQFPKNRGEMPFEVIDRLTPLISFAEYVGLAGNGEPFLHSRIMDILERIVDAGSVPSVVTNATLLDEECIDRLLSLKKVILVCSIDSAKKETFEYIRRGANFESVIENLRMLKRKKDVRGQVFPIVNFIVCVMKQNVDELSDLVRLAHEVGAPLVLAQNILPYTDWARENMITDEERVREPVMRAHETARELGIKFTYIPMGKPMDEKTSEQLQSSGKGFYCEFIWQQLHVEVDGNVRYCCFWTKGATGNVLTESPMALWNSRGFRELRAQFRQGSIPDDCRECHMRVQHNPGKIIQQSFQQLKEIWKH